MPDHTLKLRTLKSDLTTRTGYRARAGQEVWTVHASVPRFLNIVRPLRPICGPPLHGGVLACDVSEDAFETLPTTP